MGARTDGGGPDGGDRDEPVVMGAAIAVVGNPQRVGSTCAACQGEETGAAWGKVGCGGGGESGSSGLGGSYDVIMSNKDELLAQVKGMSEEEAAQVRIVFAPEWPSKRTSIEEIRKRTGTRPMSPEEFDRHFGDLSTDGEG